MIGAQLSIPALIAKKRDGMELSDEEIRLFVTATCDGTMQQAQIGAMLMAIRLSDMTERETIQLTQAMVCSGDVLTWPDEWRHLVVDKHSTGGVGDKVSLVLAPALAACGCKVPMISGRGLGHTGGTLDKLESIPGFSTSQSLGSIRDILESVGCCIVGQTKTLVPADAAMYAIRDVTSTVDSIPLAAGSIVSKKSAEGLAALVLDIKVGKAALSTDIKFIRKLAQTLVSVSNGQGIKTTGLLTKMDSPLGNMVGNALEIIESIQCLHGEGPKPLTKLICDQGGHLLHSIALAPCPLTGSKIIARTLQDGSALAKFCAMLKAQGVAPSLADNLCSTGADVRDLLPRARHQTDVTSLKSGYISEIDAMVCALVSNALGAGRTTTDSIIDPAVGLQIKAHVGQHVKKDDVILTIHHNGMLRHDDVTQLQHAVSYTDHPDTDANNLVVDVF